MKKTELQKVQEKSDNDKSQVFNTPITPFTVTNSLGNLESKPLISNRPGETADKNSSGNSSIPSVPLVTKETMRAEENEIPFGDEVSPIKGIQSHNFYLHKYISTAQTNKDGSPCGYVYNPALGVPERGIPPGTDIALLDPNTIIAPGGDRAYWFVPYQEVSNVIYNNGIMYQAEDVIETPFTDEPEISTVIKNTILVSTAPDPVPDVPESIFESLNPGPEISISFNNEVESESSFTDGKPKTENLMESSTTMKNPKMMIYALTVIAVIFIWKQTKK